MIHHPQHQLNVRHSRPRPHYLKIHQRRVILKNLESVQRHQFFQNILATEGHFLLEDHFPRTFYKKDYFSRTKKQGHFVKDIFAGTFLTVFRSLSF